MNYVESPREDLLAFIAQENCTDEQFDEMAIRLFSYQFQASEPYRRFCQRRGVGRRNVKSWRDIPAVPIDAFKAIELRCEPPNEAERVFMTSGTTRADIRGRHFHPNLAIYDLSMIRNFSQRFMLGQDRLAMGILFPDEIAMPNSSLAHYLGLAKSQFGTEDSRYFITDQGVDLDGLWQRLTLAQQRDEPYALLGASYSFVHILDALRESNRFFSLPVGSRILDTGGYKNQSREMPLSAFYGELSERLGVPLRSCINMYGMTELSTQFYDNGNETLPAVKSGPHWIRSRLVDPATGKTVPEGERGILVHCDLANINSVSTILTEDVGEPADGGFLLLGRAQGAQAKGCSLAVEDFIRATAT